MKYFVFFLYITLTFPITVFGVSVTFDSQPDPRGVRITAFLNTEGTVINAIEGVIIVSGSNPVSVEPSRGIVSLWAEPPTVSDNTVSFAGIIPGGFSGILTPGGTNKPGEIFSIVVSGIGTTTITSKGVRGFVHDGQGTEITLEVEESVFVSDISSPITIVSDIVPPTGFDGAFVDDSSFEDKTVFAFYDLDGDVAYFEVKELFGSWHRVRSPYVIQNPIPWLISLRAVDNFGNTHTKKFIHPHQKKTVLFVMVSGILVIFFAIFGTIRIRK